MSNFSFTANKFVTSTFEVDFNNNISKVEYNNEIYLVLLEIPKDSKEIDNLYGVDVRGTVRWRDQSIKDAFGIPQNSPYASLDIVGNGTVKVTNFYGMRFSVNTKNGKLIEKESIGW